VDVRSHDEYTGKVIAPPGMNETAQRGGHVPGAKSIPWGTPVATDGTFKSAAEYNVACGVRPPGLDHRFFSVIAAINSWQFIALPESARTL
jgi:hypothetical protein